MITDEDLDRLADRVWWKLYEGIPMGARMTGIDIAANNVNNKMLDGSAYDTLINRPLGSAGFTLGERIVGIDIAANSVNNQIPAIMDAIKAVANANGVDISGIADQVQDAVKASLEKINLEVTVKE